MAVARRNIVDSETPGFYHCTNRCVRRAFLCGKDKKTGIDYSDRKGWLEKRFVELCDIFSVDIYAYAVMDNHYHIVLYLDPLAPQKWSDKDVAEKWLLAYPGKLGKSKFALQRELKKQAIMGDKAKLKIYRKRLGKLSWFMGRINEPLAKKSNEEDDCTGAFWESRYTSQALLDEASVLSCMCYVDLNPVRAKITKKLETSNHTAIKKRIEKVERIKANNCTVDLNQTIEAVAGNLKSQRMTLSTRDYFYLLEWTGKSIIHPNKASVPANIKSIIEGLNLQQTHWLKQIENFNQHYCHVVGSVELIREKAKAMSKRCLRGISSAKQLFVTPS